MNYTITIKKDRIERIIANKHPWIFSGAIDKVSPEIKAGDIVAVGRSSENKVAYAAYNPKSDIALRVLSWDSNEHIDTSWYENRIKKLSQTKEELLGIENLPQEKKNYRLAFSDADSLPGLTIDRYGLVFVIQLQTLFADLNRELWVSLIKKLFKPAAIYERSDAEVRKKEGLSSFPSNLLYGALPKPQIMEENGFSLLIDIEKGQKTGFFLDLRQARKKVEFYCGLLKINHLKNYFGYTGAFNLYAARAGVKIIEHIDSSENANETAMQTAKLNKFENSIKTITGDCYKDLENTKNESVDAIILDPPSFVKTRDKIGNAAQAYERLNELAMRKLKPGGILFSFCCSSYISEELFQKILFKASARSLSNMKVLENFGHELDHAWPLSFPESRYFQGWILKKES